MKNRDQWSNQLGFILAIIGSTIGLGSIWRFPYQAYENGGGAFLIPYIIALLTVGIPLLILEMGFGYKAKVSAPMAFRKINKKFEWVGWWSVIVGFIVTIYYAIIIAWSFGYLIKSFNLGWGTNPEKYFIKDFLGATNSIWNLKSIQISILFCLIITWLANYLIIIKGVKSGIEKANKIFMPLLAFLIILITIRGVTLPGSIEGVKAFIKPDFSRINDWKIWINAYGQVFFTLSLGFGIMITYASYLPKKSDITTNGMIAASASTIFSIIIGFGVFGILGYMATQQGIPISEVVISGIGLAFIAFPKAINLLPAIPNIIAILFFSSLVVAGLSSSISLVESVTASLMDKFNLERKKAVSIICGLGFLLGIPFATSGGLVLLDIVDHFLNKYGLVLVGFIEAVVLSYFYDLNKIEDLINPYSKLKVGTTWKLMTRYLAPITLGLGFILNLLQDFSHVYGGYSSLEVSIFGWGSAILAIIISFILTNKEKRLESAI